jgi:heptosyltransferase-1
MSGGPEAAGRPRILLLRTSSLGDVVHSLPVLRALRRHLPQAALGWVVEAPFAPLLAGHPDLDQLIVVRLRQWAKRPFAPRTVAGIAGFLGDVDRFAPGVVLDLMGNHKAGVLGVLSLARRRIGAGRAFRREPSSALWLTETVPVRGAHAVDHALSLLDALGLPREPADFGGEVLFAGDRAAGGADAADAAGRPDAAAAAEVPEGIGGFGGFGAAGNRRVAVLHPGAGWGNKVYPPAWWGRAARLLHAATGVRTLVAAAPGEEALAAAVAAAAGPGGAAAAAVVPAPSLPALAALLRRASLVLGGDTGPLHLAHALGTPVLMLMGPTDPERTGPYGAPERALWRRLPCSFCAKRFAEAKACLLEIPPERVAERAAALLD